MGMAGKNRKVLVRTLPKTQFLFRLALACLPVAGFAGVALAAKTKTKTAQPAAQVATTEVPKAPEMSPLLGEQIEDGVAAVVNDQVVTEYDLRQRLLLAVSTSGMQPTTETVKRLRPQILDQLKTEKLELEEAQRKNITVSPNEVDKEIEGIIKDNNMTMDQLKGILAHDNVAMETLRAQIATQLAWQKAIEDEYADRINITPADIDDEYARIAEGKNKVHFLVGEIFLSVESPEQEDKILKAAQDLEAQIGNGAPFPSIARQFSQSPSAATGGDIGLVYDGQLAPDLNEALRKLGVHGVSPPIRSAGGYYILMLRQRLEPADAKIPDAATQLAQQQPQKPGYLPIARLLLPMPPKPRPDYVQNVLKAAGNIRGHIVNCEQMQKMVQTALKGAVFMNLGEMKLADLSAEMQAALAKTTAGQSTEPFVSPAGVEIIARCDKAIEVQQQFLMPSRDEVERRLFQEQISMLARRYIRDLKREGNVETR
jgi:peptidyl-prolyl cis-trans isomerase SurA